VGSILLRLPWFDEFRPDAQAVHHAERFIWPAACAPGLAGTGRREPCRVESQCTNGVKVVSRLPFQESVGLFSCSALRGGLLWGLLRIDDPTAGSLRTGQFGNSVWPT
jgi:hypothetical protein